MSRLSPRSLSLCAIITLAACTRRAPAPPSTTCGREIPEARLWIESTDPELERAIREAQACARSRGTKVLLEFVAPWCDDCREMTRLDRTPEVSALLHRRFEHVRVNVGRWDQHTTLLRRYRIDRIAAYVVLDAQGNPVAQTVLEPITGGHGPMTATQWMAWLENAGSR